MCFFKNKSPYLIKRLNTVYPLRGIAYKINGLRELFDLFGLSLSTMASRTHLLDLLLFLTSKAFTKILNQTNTIKNHQFD